MKTRYIFLTTAILFLASCAKEGMEQVAAPGEAIKLSSYRQQVFTRADVDEFEFAKDTKYTLLAVNAAADPQNVDPTAYNWDSQKGFATQPQAGVETEDHAISYSPVSIFHAGNRLDFYGVTFGTPEAAAPALAAAVADGVSPTVNLAEASDRLQDLMHSNTVKNRMYTDGIITMPFEHALAAVNFMISKQDETNDDEDQQQLNNVKVTEIRLDNVAEAATMDIVDGKWTWTATNVGSRTVYSNTAGEAIQTTTTKIGENDVLIFPNDDYVDGNNVFDDANPYKYYTPAGDESANKGEQVIVTVKLEGLEVWESAGNWVPMNKHLACGVDVVDGACEISFPLRNYHETEGTDDGPLHFLRNHKYVLSIFVMRDNVRIVAISPQVYEWVSMDLNSAEFDHNVTTLGQPVTFGGTVWMDRNLGAHSADCENDWWHTLGYYWEYGRNIPFIVDVDVIKRYNYGIPDTYSNGSLNSRHNLCDPNGNQIQMNENANPSWPHYLIYTWDNNGNKVSKVNLSKTLLELKGTGTAPDGDYLAIEPGDKGSYAYTAVSGIYWYGPAGSTEAVTWLKDRWEYFSDGTHRPKVENQPVPKGWRLPNAKDVYSIMPEETLDWQAPDNTQRFVEVGVLNGPYSTYNRASNNGTQEVDLVTATNDGPTNAYKYVGDYKYQFFYGNIDVRKNATGNFSTPIRGRWDQTLLFGIKHQGTPQAYRYKIEMLESNVHNGWFVRFTQYPTSSTDKFEAQDTNNDGKPDTWNLHKFDWDHPSAYLDFPMSGEIYPSTYHYLGSILKLRLQNYLNAGNNYCMKLSNQGTGFMSTYHITTGPTRLVRDLEAN